jgi:hypothetical protein
MASFLLTLEIVAAVVLGLFVYFIPAINAYGRHHNNRTAILLCNLFLGWTFLGWVASLVWSATTNVTLEPVK